ncbi:hypothetical protein VKT23_013885 [Stygiomarasmius scandens]|uniref:Uncharacterized protein n=1 Tax=Marasmiellus scandens TaxID=2682957 RepID=A0ABR1J6U2_9AGAR
MSSPENNCATSQVLGSIKTVSVWDQNGRIVSFQEIPSTSHNRTQVQTSSVGQALREPHSVPAKCYDRQTNSSQALPVQQLLGMRTTLPFTKPSVEDIDTTTKNLLQKAQVIRLVSTYCWFSTLNANELRNKQVHTSSYLGTADFVRTTSFYFESSFSGISTFGDRRFLTGYGPIAPRSCYKNQHNIESFHSQAPIIYIASHVPGSLAQLHAVYTSPAWSLSASATHA